MKLPPEQTKAAYDKAAALVKAGKFDEARAMKDQLLKSDWQLIEDRIAAREAPSLRENYSL